MGGTAVSFWIISIAMIACTVFLFAEAATVKDHWKTSMHVGGLVTLVAGVHYMYMREFGVQVHKSPIVYRYIDWTITVPLQMIEFNLILKAAGKPVGAMMFWRLLVGTVVMLAFGYAGETGVLPALIGFVIGMAGWGFILYQIFTGEAGGTVGDCSPAAASNFQTMRLIVTIGWAIYPLGCPWHSRQHARCRRYPQLCLQHCRLREQDWLRPFRLVCRQGRVSLRRQGRGSLSEVSQSFHFMPLALFRPFMSPMPAWVKYS